MAGNGIVFKSPPKESNKRKHNPAEDYDYYFILLTDEPCPCGSHIDSVTEVHKLRLRIVAGAGAAAVRLKRSSEVD